MKIASILCFVTTIVLCQNVLEDISKEPSLSSLNAALNYGVSPGLRNCLTSNENLTFMAPSNFAFENANFSNPLYPGLNNTLFYHLATKLLPNFANSVVPLDMKLPSIFYKTNENSLACPVRFNNYSAFAGLKPVLTVNGQVFENTIKASNGGIVVVGAFLYPPIGTLVQTLIKSDFGLSLFFNYFAKCTPEAQETLISSPTIFVPNNKAFLDVKNLLSGFSAQQISNLLLNHALNYSVPIFSPAFPSVIDLANSAGSFLRIRSVSGVVSVESSHKKEATVVTKDIFYLGGVLHSIDLVLFP